MANDGRNNWAHPYIPGRETPRSLMRFIPHDEEAGATELKNVYPRAKTRKKLRRPNARQAAWAMLGRR